MESDSDAKRKMNKYFPKRRKISKNDITGEPIISRNPNDKYKENYDKIDWSRK